MIRRIELANLKAFAGRHDVQLSPLTLVYGANSAGKSTLIQALLLLKQTLENSELEQPALVIRGPLADLGSVPGIIHGHSDTRTLEIGLEFDARSYQRQPVPIPNRIAFAFRWDEDAHAVRQTSVRFGHRQDPIVTFTRRRGPYSASIEPAKRDSAPFRIGRENARTMFLRWMLSHDGPHSPASHLGTSVGAEELAALTQELTASATYATGAWGIIPVQPDFSFKPDATPSQTCARALEEVEEAWFMVLLRFRQDLLLAIGSLAYLGPLRRAPERFYLLSGAQRKTVGREGEYAAEILSRRPDLLERVNYWLERMEIPYALSAEHVAGGDIRHSIGDVVVLMLTHKRNRALKLSPGDVGFGISQLLPIVVQVLSGTGITLCVEQPEIHVHPRLQANMADLFVEAVQSLGNQVVVETHSEHLMLRLQRLIRRGEFDPQDVAILYVDEGPEGSAVVSRIELNRDGTFATDWPRGFFDERLNEIFGD